QVLQEFYVNVTKRADVTLPPAKAAEWVAAISMKPCQDLDSAVVMRGIENSQRYQISYWDGAIIAAAERLGVKTLYTEDLNHGQAYGSVVAVNPFR
ncbi:MAG: PIN domain-containing protein, partial [Mesorhizobium sp.]